MPSVLIFCHRFFEFRFILVSGIVEELAKKARLTVMLPADLAESFRALLPPGTEIKIAHYGDSIGKGRMKILNILDDILYLTFPHTDILPNATAAFHRDHYITRYAITRFVVVQSSLLASRFKFIRLALVALYQSLLPKTIHADLIKEVKPDVMAGCSFGMGVWDACFLAEAKHNNISSAVIVQSWDRTSNKGYPTIHPNHALVWNDIMKKECEVQLEFPPGTVHITGSPLWDEHFSKLNNPPDPEWRSKLGISPDRKIIFFACGGFGSHPANLKAIPQVFDLARRQPFSQPIHVIFRLYPQYLAPVTKAGEGKQKREEIEALLSQYAEQKNISILYPEVKFDGKNFMPSASDHVFMTECLRQCDISLSQVSSQMIEACIFDKPAVNIEFGRRVTEKYDLEICDYKTEHLMRVYRTNAIYRAQKPEDLEKIIKSALDKPDEKTQERINLVNQEAPINQGSASESTADIIYKIGKGSL